MVNDTKQKGTKQGACRRSYEVANVEITKATKWSLGGAWIHNLDKEENGEKN